MSEQLIGNYRVLKQIGAGGMAKVYLAVHKDIPNLKVILKILSDPRLVQRFKQEADKLALLDGNANICRIKHFFTHGDDVVIAMEYIDGVTLEEKLKTDGKLPISESLRIVASVLDILDFAHERGVCHRDIKPSNIMIDTTGTVKIIDFGIAKGESDPSLTLAGTACGTPAFMAPEQFTPSEDTDYVLIDVYATGTTLYCMLTGQQPFKGENEFALRDAKLFTEPARPRDLASGISRELEACVLRAIEKRPEDRFQSAKEMRKAVKALSRDGETRQIERTQDVPAAPPKKKSKPLPMALLGGVAAGVVVIALILWWSLSPSEPGPPAVAELLGPEPGQVFAESGRPILTWNRAVDDNGSYILEYATDSLFTDSRTIAGLQNTEFAFTTDLPNGLYFWRVHTVGVDGQRGDPSLFRVFTIETAAVTGSRLLLQVTPRGDIYVDDELLGSRTDKIERTLDTGIHIIRIENNASRERRFRDTVNLAMGDTVSRSYRFTFPPAPPPEPTTGEVRVGSRPRGADIYIDGRLQPQKTNYTFQLPPGRHIVRATLLLEGEVQEHADTLRVVADSTHKVIFEFQ
jgi:serine/threonine protein kinase